jgi:hypothetical protein
MESSLINESVDLITFCYTERSGFIWAGIQGGVPSTGYMYIVEIRFRSRSVWSQMVLLAGQGRYKVLAGADVYFLQTGAEVCGHKRTDIMTDKVLIWMLLSISIHCIKILD